MAVQQRKRSPVFVKIINLTHFHGTGVSVEGNYKNICLWIATSLLVSTIGLVGQQRVQLWLLGCCISSKDRKGKGHSWPGPKTRRKGKEKKKSKRPLPDSNWHLATFRADEDPPGRLSGNQYWRWIVVELNRDWC